MEIPTEPIGSIPRPLESTEALRAGGDRDAMAAAVLGARS